VLGIETSCDDSCVAVLDIEPQAVPRIRHNIVRRSLMLSEPYGGIVPNVVAMFHVNALGNALSEVRDAGGFKNVDLIAVTRGICGLWTFFTSRTWNTDVSRRGIELWYIVPEMCLISAKGLSVALNVPIIGVHHMVSHPLTER
jgi:N6-L-threonylcarbamoyladenine synthase